MIIHNEYIEGSTVSGELAANTRQFLMGIVRQIVVKPATGTTTYNLSIVNDNSIEVFYSNSITGNFSEETALPFRGVYTITISEATKDEAFKIGLLAEE